MVQLCYLPTICAKDNSGAATVKPITQDIMYTARKYARTTSRRVKSSMSRESSRANGSYHCEILSYKTNLISQIENSIYLLFWFVRHSVFAERFN